MEHEPRKIVTAEAGLAPHTFFATLFCAADRAPHVEINGFAFP